MSATDAATGAERAVARLREMSVDLRECAILDPAGRQLAASAEGSWEGRGAELWDAASDAAKASPNQIHVAVEEGEVFAVRSAAGTAIAITERFALASLMFCDLRAALRELDAPASEAAS